MLNRSASLAMSTSILKALPDKLDIKRHSPIILYVYLFDKSRSGPEVIKLFLCSSQLSMIFILLINVKMPTIVGTLTFISMINTTSERLKAINFFIIQQFRFHEQLKFRAQ